MVDKTSEFVALWTQCHTEVRRYVSMLVPRSADIDDVVQQTASKLWANFEKYDSDRPFLPWAIRFAYHEVLSMKQRHGRERLVFSERILSQLHAAIGEEASLLELRRRALDGCLRKLSGPEKRLLEARYGASGTVQREAAESQTAPHKLYYTIEKLRVRLLTCIEGAMRREGWANG